MIPGRLLIAGVVLAAGGCAPAERPAGAGDGVEVETPAPPAANVGDELVGYRAGGNEPFWTLTFGDSTIDFADMGTNVAASAPRPDPEQTSDGWRFTATSNGQPLVVEVRTTGCNDSMSGLPFPDEVRVSVMGQTYTGCGGEPQDLLTGPEWRVTHLAGEETAATRKPTLNFSADSTLTGNGSCNNYRATYRLTGEGITIGPAMATKMACAEAPLNVQETSFFSLLAQVDRFELEEGKLGLYAGDRLAIVGER